MSKEKNNNDDLKKFLSPGNLPADDFEKEALEGFAMLGNEQEALDLKQSLDDKISKKIFVSEKTSAARTYWLAAAAGLLLLVGFCVYFITGTTATITRSKDLAIVSPESPDEFKPVPQAPADETQTTVLKEEEKSEQLPAVPVQHTDAQPAPPVNTAARNRPATKDQKNTAQEEFITTSSSEGEADHISAGAGVKQEKQAVAADNNSDKKLNNTAEVPPEMTIASNESITKNNMSFETKEYSLAPPEPKSASAAPKFKAANKPITVPAAETKKSAGACYYTGGEEALHKDLAIKLAAKNINLPFEAVVSIDENRTVTKADLTKPYALNKVQQAQVVEILRSLDKFNFSEKPKHAAEYTVVYVP